MPTPSLADVERRLEAADLDEWLRLWRTEQGPSKPAALALMASAIPAAPDAPLRVLDLCCGPGDVGRTIHARFPAAEVDAVDRDVLLAGLCRLANRRAGVRGRTELIDLADPAWRAGFEPGYDVVAVAYALHWFTATRATALVGEALELLRAGGVLLFMEPARAAAPFAPGFEAWRATLPPEYRREDWFAFWSRVNAFLGYDHMDLQGAPPAGRLGDSLSALDWAALAGRAGFDPVDVLLRDATKVVVAAVKPSR